MCALFGWLDYKGIVPYKILRKLTQALANAAEERGTDAAGISYVENGKVKINKSPKPAHKIKFSFPEGTKAVMGHTRMTTQGNEKNNYNNHPFPGHAGETHFSFAHNGVLYNDEKLRKEKKLPKTKIETDSYVAVQLIEQSGKLDFESLKNMAEAVKGSFAFTALTENNKLYIIKGSNPMFLLHFESLGIFIYASTESIMKKALKRTSFERMENKRIRLDEGDIISIGCGGNVEISEFHPEFKHPFGTFNNLGWYDDYYDSYSDSEQILLEMCPFYGVDEEDVMLLLDYGYSTDEIEELLLETDELQNILKNIKDESECSILR